MYTRYDANYVTFWKRPNFGDSEKDQGLPELGLGGRGETKRWSTEDLGGSEHTLYDVLMTDICHYTFEWTTPRVNPKVNSGL